MAAIPAIAVSQLTKEYKGADHPAVNELTLNIKRGDIFGLLGPNGAGKTTTISMMCGLLRPTSGDIIIEGIDLNNRLEEVKKIIGVVPQDIALYPALSAFENLKYIGNMYGLRGETLKARILEGLEIFGLEDKKDRRVESFSGGMKRRINLLAGIIHKPKVLFLDEPTVGVDVQSRSVITQYLKQINKEGTTIVYTSHLMEEAEQLCTKISIIDEGLILCSGSPSSLIKDQNCNSLEEVFLQLTGRKLRD